jgi:catechol 2,3-dioxygenase-like lactoylglutathione lyase family enzyme
MLKNAPIIPYIPVADVKRARAFYERTLGFAPKDENEGGVFYECGKGTRVFLYKSTFAGTNKASCAFFTIDNLETEMADLRTRGVVFENYDLPGMKTVNGVVVSPGGTKNAWFKDPDGNIMALIQPAR